MPPFTWPASEPREPVVNVTFCDALAYCEWAGKRLCARPDGSRGDLRALPSSSTWTLACGRNYPYGERYDPDACNTKDAGRGRVAPVASFPSCERGGVFDMSGNVWEWEDACTMHGDRLFCAVRGGGFRNDEHNSTCAGFYEAPIETRYDYYGFRCCSR